MNRLLDTHALLWSLAGSPLLSATALAAIDDPANMRRLSPISRVEIAIEVRINKLRLPAPFGVLLPSRLTTNQIRLFPVAAEHAASMTTLPLHHRDPFDRLIVATSLIDKLVLVSADATHDVHGITRLW